LSLGRSAVCALQGMVAAEHPLAAAEGLQVLRAGGNAADAAIAMSGVLSVAQPMLSGPGGDCFCLWFDGGSREVWAVNGSGAAPRAATIEAYAARGHRDRLPSRGILTVAVPGMVDATCTILERWGSGRFTLEQLWRPAVRHARDGIPVARQVARYWAEAEGLAGQHPALAAYLPGGRAPREGEVFAQPEYARTLDAIARGGRDAFYRGELGERIVAHCRERGGLLAAEDLEAHASEVHRPLSTTYRGLQVFTMAPPSQGIILLEELAVAAGWDLGGWPHLSAEAVHHLIEAKKLAFADRSAFVGDPRFVPFDAGRLLERDWVGRRRASVDPRRAAQAAPVAPRGPAESTTYLCAVDRDGNAISFITSVSGHWGCGEVVEGTGIVLNNRAGRGFSLVSSDANALAPGKRPMNTLHCYIATRDGCLSLVGGTPGGDGQPQYNLQVLTSMLDWGLGVQAAIEAPRWLSTPGTDPVEIDDPYGVKVEEGFPEASVQGLQDRGHQVARVGRFALTGAAVQLIRLEETGALVGGSDPRSDGCALGY
jgi:gamma-glutamyltranspeptidase/glutathione hydrolase